MPCREGFSFQICLDVSVFGSVPVCMCCYRLAVQIERWEVYTWEDRKANKQKDRVMAAFELYNKKSEVQIY